MPALRRDHQERASAAFDVAARSPRRLRLSVSEAARATHAPRSYFYEYWSSSIALGEDLAFHRATRPTCWQEQVRAGGHDDVFRCLADALRSPEAAGGATQRAVLAAGPADGGARARLRAWDARWLAWLGGRLRTQLGDQPGVPWAAAALVATALVEGTLLVRGPRTGGVVAPFDDAFAELVAATAARATAAFAEQVTGADLALLDHHPVPDDDAAPAGAMRLLGRVAGAVERGALVVHPDDHRMVSVAALADGLGVSTRWVHRCWPTAAALNADLFDEGLRRLAGAVDRCTRDAFAASMAADGSARPLLQAEEARLDLARHPEPLALLGMADRHDHTDLADRHRPAMEVWAAANEIQAAALLHAGGHHLRPSIAMVDAADLAAGAWLGACRLLAADPGLAGVRCSYGRVHDVSVLAVLGDLTTLATVSPPPDDVRSASRGGAPA